MRIYLASMAHPKRLSKRLSSLMDVKLSRAQLAVANMFGYQSWHELEQVTASGKHEPSKPDYLVSAEVQVSRFDYQETKLFDAFADDFVSLAELPESIIEELQPSASIPFGDHLDMKLLEVFPLVWSSNGIQFLKSKLNDKFTVSVGHQDSIEAFSSITGMLDEKEPSSRKIKQEHGYRIFCASPLPNNYLSDINEGKPAAILTFRMVPTIMDEVVVGCEIELTPFSYASDHLDDDDRLAIAHSICAYLHSSGLNKYCDGNYSGSHRGVHIHLTGTSMHPGVTEIMGLLEYILEEARDEWDPDDYENFAYDPYAGFLPILSVDSDYIIEHEGEKEEIEPDPDLLEALEGRGQIFSAMIHAPVLLATHLQSNGHHDFAEFARVFDVDLDNKPSVIKFMEFVRAMEKSNAITNVVSITLRNFYVECFAAAISHLNSQNNDEDDGGFLTGKYIQSALQLKDRELADEYSELGLILVLEKQRLGLEVLDVL